MLPAESSPLPLAKPVLPVAGRAIPNVLPVDIPTVEPMPPEPFDPLAALIQVIRSVHSAAVWCFGIFTLLIALAVLAAIPVLQFLTLGYLLEAGGRVARSGRLRSALIGVRQAARFGGIAVGCWLVLLPARIVEHFAYDAYVIDPGGRIAKQWRLGMLIITVFAGLHLAFALARGGKLRYFAWPFNFIWFIRRLLRGGYYTQARDAVWDSLMKLRLPYYFWLGLRGFAVGFAWLALPVSLLALNRWNNAAAPIIGIAGAVLLVLVLPYVPFLQTRMAERNRLRAGFDVLAVRRTFRKAPWLHAFAFFIVLLFALPLYLLKIETVPSEAEWLPSLIFVGFIFPAKVLAGWAVGRANARGRARHWFWRWSARLTFWPVATAYVVVLFFTQYTSWNGIWSLYEQHAFLLPAPRLM
jgi:hypothetical protein